MIASEAKALLFDLGGVVIETDFDQALRAWQPLSRLTFHQLQTAFRHDLFYQRFERGEIASAVYCDHLVSCLELTASHEQIAKGWNAIYVGEIVETTKLIQQARNYLSCFAFTNTNEAHQAAWSIMFLAVVSSFDRLFASHELGYRKPERETFKVIPHAIGESPESIVFFDDLRENIEGALLVGFQGVLDRAHADVRSELRELGVEV